MRWSTLGAVGVAGVIGATSAGAAENVSLYLKVNGQDIKGESTQKSMGRQDAIECVQLNFGALGNAQTRRYESIRCTKRIDKASPLLMRALAAGQNVDGTFKFFRPNPTGDGTTEQFYTIQFKQGRIDSIKVTSPNAFDPAGRSLPASEEVSINFKNISFTYTNGGISSQDTVR